MSLTRRKFVGVSAAAVALVKDTSPKLVELKSSDGEQIPACIGSYQYPTKIRAEGDTLVKAPDQIRTKGFAVVCDGGAARYKRNGNKSGHITITLHGGTTAGYDLSEPYYRGEMFGLHTDNSSAKNDAAFSLISDTLKDGDLLVISSGTFRFTRAIFKQDDITILFEDGAYLLRDDTVRTAFSLVLAGKRNKLVNVDGIGGVKQNISVFADYDTTGSGISHAIVKVTGDNFLADGISIDSPSRCGIYISGASNPIIRNCSGNGGFLDTQHDPDKTLNLYAVFYNPDGANYKTSTFTIHNNNFQKYISAIGSGVLSGSGSFRPEVSGNYFKDCTDHCCYLLSTKFGRVKDNISLNCRIPFAIDMNGVHYVDNYHFWDGVSGNNREALLSLRNMRNGAVCSGNIMVGGRGCGIDARPVAETYNSENIVISNNVLMPGANSALLTHSIRVENTGGKMVRPRIVGNVIFTYQSGRNSAIYVAGRSGAPVMSAEVSKNTIQHRGGSYAIRLDHVDDILVEKNKIDRSGYASGTATTVDNIYITNANRPVLRQNEHLYMSGGTNVISRGVNLAASVKHAKIVREQDKMASVNLAATVFIVDKGITTKFHETR